MLFFGSFLSDTSSGDAFSLKDRRYFLFLSLPPPTASPSLGFPTSCSANGIKR